MQLALDLLFAISAMLFLMVVFIIVFAPAIVKLLVLMPIVSLALFIFVAQRTE